MNRDFDISRENCQRAKVLSAQTQGNERIALIKNIQEAEREKQISLFDTETKKYELNDICEKRIVNMFYSTTTQQDRNKQIDATIRKTFTEITTDLKIEHFGRNNIKGLSKDCKPNMDHYKSFIQSKATNRKI